MHYTFFPAFLQSVTTFGLILFLIFCREQNESKLQHVLASVRACMFVRACVHAFVRVFLA